MCPDKKIFFNQQKHKLHNKLNVANGKLKNLTF